MAKLHELRRKKSELATQLRDKKAELRTLKAQLRQKLEDAPDDKPYSDDIKELRDRVDACERSVDEHQQKIDEHEDRIKDMEATQDNDVANANPVGSDDPNKGWSGLGTLDADGRITPHGYGEKQASAAIAADPLKGKGFAVTRFAMGIVMAKSSGFDRAAEFIERRYGDKAVAKALNTAGVSTGGALIPQDFYNEIIELLRAEAIVRKQNPVSIPMPLGNMTIPRLAGGATAGFQGELDDINSSQESFDDVQLNAKKLTALVPISNDLIRRAPVGVEQLVRDDLLQTIARREDLAMLIGDGTAGSVIGLLNLANALNKLTVSAFTDNTNATIFNTVSAVLFALRLTLKQNMSRMLRPVWLMAPGTEAFLMGLITQFGFYAYKEEMEKGKLLGVPLAVTQQLPTNINTGTTQSPVNNGAYLFLVDFADVILAETMNVMVDASDVASYKDTGGNMVSTYARDQTAFRVIEEFDFNLRHQASVAVAVVSGWLPAGYTGNSGAAYYVQAASGDMSAAASTWGSAAPTGSNNPASIAANVPGGVQPGRP